MVTTSRQLTTRLPDSSSTSSGAIASPQLSFTGPRLTQSTSSVSGSVTARADRTRFVGEARRTLERSPLGYSPITASSHGARATTLNNQISLQVPPTARTLTGTGAVQVAWTATVALPQVRSTVPGAVGRMRNARHLARTRSRCGPFRPAPACAVFFELTGSVVVDDGRHARHVELLDR